MEKTRVLFIRNGYYPDDPRLKKQINALLELNFQVDVICLRKKGQNIYEKKDNLIITRFILPNKRGGVLWYFFEYVFNFLFFLASLSLKYFYKKYNFIVVHTLPDFLTFTTIIPKLFGAKIITDFHEPTPELVMTKFKYTDKNILVKFAAFIEQAVLSYSDLNITVTNSLKNQYIKRGANFNKIVVISNAVDTQEIAKIAENIPVIKNGYFKILTHGSIEERYGHEVVINAISILQKDYPNIKYYITGKGTYEKKLKELVRKLKLDNLVEFKGYLEFESLIRLIKSADLGIIPMYKTPYSKLIDTNKMYEFFELKVPVALPKLEPLIENFDDSEVIFFEPGDKNSLAEVIRSYIEFQDKKERLIENASKKYEKLKWDKVKTNFQNIFLNNLNLCEQNSN